MVLMITSYFDICINLGYVLIYFETVSEHFFNITWFDTDMLIYALYLRFGLSFLYMYIYICGELDHVL